METCCNFKEWLSKESIAQYYPVAGNVVDGMEVVGSAPNMESIGASINNPIILPNVRIVQMAQFTLDKAPLATDNRTKDLAAKIQASKKLTPLIVAVDEQGPYILEGGHRYDALKLLGAKAFPAIVVLDGE